MCHKNKTERHMTVALHIPRKKGKETVWILFEGLYLKHNF